MQDDVDASRLARIVALRLIGWRDAAAWRVHDLLSDVAVLPAQRMRGLRHRDRRLPRHGLNHHVGGWIFSVRAAAVVAVERCECLP